MGILDQYLFTMMLNLIGLVTFQRLLWLSLKEDIDFKYNYCISTMTSFNSIFNFKYWDYVFILNCILFYFLFNSLLWLFVWSVCFSCFLLLIKIAFSSKTESFLNIIPRDWFLTMDKNNQEDGKWQIFYSHLAWKWLTK